MGNRNRYADYINYRVIETAQYFINNEATVRETAKHIGVSKSTAHKDLTERLPRINRLLYEQVYHIIEKNKQERHMRGGIATQEKFKGKRRVHGEKTTFIKERRD